MKQIRPPLNYLKDNLVIADNVSPVISGFDFR